MTKGRKYNNIIVRQGAERNERMKTVRTRAWRHTMKDYIPNENGTYDCCTQVFYTAAPDKRLGGELEKVTLALKIDLQHMQILEVAEIKEEN